MNDRRPGHDLDCKSGLLRSRDGGQSWEYVGDVTGFEDRTGELGIAFVDGDLLALCRVVDDSTTVARRSPDCGETWYDPVHLNEHAWPAPFGDCGYCDLLASHDGLYVAT